jgi:hypothetical protein
MILKQENNLPTLYIFHTKTLNDKNAVHCEKSDFLGQHTEQIRGCGVSFYIAIAALLSSVVTLVFSIVAFKINKNLVGSQKE